MYRVAKPDSWRRDAPGLFAHRQTTRARAPSIDRILCAAFFTKVSPAQQKLSRGAATTCNRELVSVEVDYPVA